MNDQLISVNTQASVLLPVLDPACISYHALGEPQKVTQASHGQPRGLKAGVGRWKQSHSTKQVSKRAALSAWQQCGTVACESYRPVGNNEGK